MIHPDAPLNPATSTQPRALFVVMFCDEAAAGLQVAGLTVPDRLTVAMHRAGAGSITLICSQTTRLERASALGIPVTIVHQAPQDPGECLVADCSVLVQPADLRKVIQQQGRLVAADGTRLPVGVISNLNSGWRDALDRRPAVTAEGIAVRVTDPVSAKTAARLLWASLTSSADGLVDKYFNRPCGRLLSKVLVWTNISPNAVSMASILIGVWAGFLFALGTFPAIVTAAIIFQLSAIVDCVDGDLARVLFKESKLGKWLDLAGDQVVHVSVFAGIAVGLVRQGSELAGWLGLSAVVGALLSFAVVVRGMRQTTGRGDLMQKLIDSVTNRDFSVLVLILACVNRLEWFLWLSAVGSHVFWLAALVLQCAASGRQTRVS